MYKCGWQGCEKAYGTLNHLNAHVTMQSHGAKRTPEGKSICCHSVCRKVAFLVRFGFLGLHLLVVLHNLSLVIGVGTINADDPTIPHASDLRWDASFILASLLTRIEPYRIQGDPEGVEGEKEGRRQPAQSRRRETTLRHWRISGRRSVRRSCASSLGTKLFWRRPPSPSPHRLRPR